MSRQTAFKALWSDITDWADDQSEANYARLGQAIEHYADVVADETTAPLVESLRQHKAALNVALAYAKGDLVWEVGTESEEEFSGCQIVLDEPMPSDG